MVPRLPMRVVLFCIAAVLSRLVSATCECGYSVNKTTDAEHAVWTELLETDFLHVKSLKNIDWQPQVYNVSAASESSPYGKMATRSNVIPNPLKNSTAWAGEALNGGDAGLQLIARSDLVDDMVPFGEIATRTRPDMLYGSFRIAMKMTGVPGTCGAFFWFRSNSQEIDMEFLSRELNATSNPINLVIHTPESAALGYDAAQTADFDAHSLPFKPDQGFHEYRFDWLPDRVSFYADGVWLRDLNMSVPDSPGVLVVNHWSNGNPNWSGGPPTENATLTISYVKAYFNSSDAQRQTEYSQRCTGNASTIAASVCQIPDQTSAPDSAADDGNSTAQTFFFSGNASQAHTVAPARFLKFIPVAASTAFACAIALTILI